MRKEIIVEDRRIITHFLERNEDALRAAQDKYGQYCYSIANNILTNPQDSEECVNDTLNILWNTIPPTVPVSLKAYMGKIIRNLALGRYRSHHAGKRRNSLDVVLDELEECIPADSNAEETANCKLLTELINNWLKTLDRPDRIVFLRRYYKCEPLSEIAKLLGVNENKAAQIMHKLRKSLREFLDKKGYEL